MTSPQYISTAHIQEIYIGLLGRAADNDGLTYWQTQISNNLLTLEQLRANIVNFQAEYINGLGAMSRAEVVDELYERLFERTPDAEGYAYWVDGPGRHVNVDQLVLALVNGANAADRLVLDNKVEAAEYYSANVTFYSNDTAKAAVDAVDGTTESVQSSKNVTDNLGVTGSEISLSVNADNLTGTVNNDTFTSLLNQNTDNTISNTFSSQDRINGSLGTDTLNAYIINDSSTPDLAITAQISEIEIIELGVRDQGVLINAREISNVEQFWSINSDSDLIISNINPGEARNDTNDVTFGLRDNSSGSGLIAAFDSSALLQGPLQMSNSQLLVRVTDSAATDAHSPLANTTITLNFKLNGVQYSISNLHSTDGSYAGLVEAFNTALPAIGLASVEATLGNSYNQTASHNTEQSLSLSANTILLSATNNASFSDISFSASPLNNQIASQTIVGEAQLYDHTSVLESNLVLDNAGRGFAAGDVIIGDAAEDGRQISVLNVAVDRNSEIGTLSSATNMGNGAGSLNAGQQTGFKQINLTSLSNQGSLKVADILDTQTFNALDFTGPELHVSGDATTANAYTYASANSQDYLSIDINLTAAELDNFSILTQTQGGDDIVEYNYQLAVTSLSSALNTTQPSAFSISAGAGDDSVILNSQTGNSAIIADIDLGSGNDTFTLTGNTNDVATAITITAGTGNDNIVLTPNRSADSNPITIKLTKDFGQDTVTHFNSLGIEDQIDYSALFAASNAGSEITYQNLTQTDTNAGTAIVDNHKVITIKLSDILQQLEAANTDLPANYTDLSATQLEIALNALLDDTNFINNGQSESQQALSSVVLNVVHDQLYTVNNGVLVFGDNTDLSYQSIFTSSVAYNPDSANTNENLTLANTTKEGSLSFTTGSDNLQMQANALSSEIQIVGVTDISASADALTL